MSSVEIPGPPVPSYYNESWKLISQGAEARVWLVPNFIESDAKETATSSLTSTVICKERFPKAYRHPSLDETLTKSRTKAEAKNLNRCRRGGVSVPVVLGVDLNTKGQNIASHSKSEQENQRNIACLFLEYVHGETIRSFLNIEQEESKEEPPSKRQKIDGEHDHAVSHKKVITRVDAYAEKAAYEVGATIARMHNVNIVHGDLTTSNILIRNPDIPEGTSVNDWKPDIVLIDFGLSSTSVNTKKTSNHEERAVDLYVLERAFVTTHVGSEDLVKEVMRGYKATCQSSDSVFVRLAQVRQRGRKRECFG